MITKAELEVFLGKRIAVATPHFFLENRYFWFYGVLLKITDTELKLKTEQGYKILQLKRVKDVHLEEKR